jgi:membrane-associated protease RseP (regulator of RpoE activity)
MPAPKSRYEHQPGEVKDSRYEPEPGRNAETIAQMRAAPAPAVPELAPGKNAADDHGALVAKGYVRIGTAHFPGTDASARDEAIRIGQEASADYILLYAPGASGDDWMAVYYVRFQLPFGATFRDLRADELDTLGAAGGVRIGSIINGTPASRANLIAGDAVLQVNGTPVANRAAFQSLLRSHAGHAVTLTIVRNGETLKRVVRLGAMANVTAP